MRQLNEILLIDDSKGANALNQRLIASLGIANTISVALNGKFAIDYLMTKNENGEMPSPELIFLDINMPVMDGFQFLEEFEKLSEEIKLNKVIVMLTSSISELDMDRAKEFSAVKGYCIKPLMSKNISEIVNQNFKLKLSK